MSSLKKRVFICGIIGIVAFIAVYGVIVAHNGNKASSPAELLSLGEKYLSELNYEQALVHFLKVIETEPMNPRGYSGAAAAYMGLGRADDAIDVLVTGIAQTGNNSLVDLRDLIRNGEYAPALYDDSIDSLANGSGENNDATGPSSDANTAMPPQGTDSLELISCGSKPGENDGETVYTAEVHYNLATEESAQIELLMNYTPKGDMAFTSNVWEAVEIAKGSGVVSLINTYPSGADGVEYEGVWYPAPTKGRVVLSVNGVELFFGDVDFAV